MSQNINNNNPTNPGTGLAGTGATDAGTTRDTSNTSGGGLQTAGGGTTGTGTAAATAREGITATAQEYGQKIADAATQAKSSRTCRTWITSRWPKMPRPTRARIRAKPC
jgi:hypothetical protein